MTQESYVGPSWNRLFRRDSMITIGVDAHKSLHVAVALDEAGKELDRWRGSNTAQGWRDILDWAQELDSQRQWGIEGAWGYGRRLAQYLVELGETVYEVNGKWTAMGRKYARKKRWERQTSWMPEPWPKC